jgi:hypothetical protein
MAKAFLLVLNGNLFGGSAAEFGKKTREFEAEISCRRRCRCRTSCAPTGVLDCYHLFCISQRGDANPSSVLGTPTRPLFNLSARHLLAMTSP